MSKISKLWLSPIRALSRGRFEYKTTFFDENGLEIAEFGGGGEPVPGPQGEQGPQGEKGPPGSDADVTEHEAAEDPHPQYIQPVEGHIQTQWSQEQVVGSFSAGPQYILSSVSTPEMDSEFNISGGAIVGAMSTPYSPADEPGVEQRMDVVWNASIDGFSTQSTVEKRPIENPGYWDHVTQGVSLTPGGIDARMRQIVLNENGVSTTWLAGARLRFPQEEISNLALPVTGNVETPEIIATQEWVAENAFATNDSVVEVTIATGTEVTEIGTLNRWTVTTDVTMVLPESPAGSGFLVHIDRLDRITWPEGTEVVGAAPDQQEAWLSLLRDQTKWVVLVAGSVSDVTAHEAAENPHPQYIKPINGNIYTQVLSEQEEGSFFAGPGGFEGNSTYLNDLGDRLREEMTYWSFNVDGSIQKTTYTTRWPNGDEEVVETQSMAAPPYIAFVRETTLPDGSETLAYRMINLGTEGISSLELPDTGMTPEIIATQEWVQSQNPLPKSVASVEDLAAHATVGDGHSTLVVALGKPVWSLNSTFVDAIGTKVWPEE